MARLQSAALSILLAGVLVLAAYADVLLVAAAVLLVQLLIAAAPSPADARGRSIPTPRFLPTLAASLVATGLAWHTGELAGVLPAVATGLFVALITQMLRKDGRRELTSSTSYAVSLGVAAALASGWIGAASSLGEKAAVTVSAAGLAAGLLAWAIPGDRVVMGGAAILAGAGGGAVVAVATDSIVTVVFGVAAGSGAALFAVLGQVLGRAWMSGRSHASSGWGFPGAMSVALAGPLAYVSGQIVATAVFS